MAYKRPLGIWDNCWHCGGAGVNKCYECGTIQKKCSTCNGLGKELKAAWVREPDDPPPLTAEETMRIWEETLTTTFESGFSSDDAWSKVWEQPAKNVP